MSTEKENVIYEDDFIQIKRDPLNFTLLMWTVPDRASVAGRETKEGFKFVGYYSRLLTLMQRVYELHEEQLYDKFNSIKDFIDTSKEAMACTTKIGERLEKILKEGRE